MKFEDFIKNISSTIAGLAVFLLAAGMYLTAKGFVMDGNGNIVLVSQAQAQEPALQKKELDTNLALPEDHVIGKSDAPITVYEYSSFGCFHCADFHLDVLPKVKSDYIDKGLVRVVFVPFPIDKPSMDAALLAECVSQDKYFAFADVLFEQQRNWGMARFSSEHSSSLLLPSAQELCHREFSGQLLRGAQSITRRRKRIQLLPIVCNFQHRFLINQQQISSQTPRF